MNSVLKIIKAIFSGGILFLAPLILLAVLLEKRFSIVQKITVHYTKVKFLALVIEEVAVIVFICSATGSQLFLFDS
ncbi:hypothetical protein [Flavobacterium tructae]|uniref:Uncharacterized protein n=1 Tax=Flavobacterium tructae TaxID=1114873 RepID=A0A1S1J9L5_9FLAO|nr:hypothetical protein [Flavobacterium tructae]OHT46199.1 hypothetical protein BHE19_01395 [Flavobacterium tructae]OXB22157.1 hypothetical protein B0A71_01420 [Flavobacterium tructae]OXB24356.1 hypothetical protein B0A80_06615 [Flavobacterium tructae]